MTVTLAYMTDVTGRECAWKGCNSR